MHESKYSSELRDANQINLGGLLGILHSYQSVTACLKASSQNSVSHEMTRVGWIEEL